MMDTIIANDSVTVTQELSHFLVGCRFSGTMAVVNNFAPFDKGPSVEVLILLTFLGLHSEVRNVDTPATIESISLPGSWISPARRTDSNTGALSPILPISHGIGDFA